ncbi:cleavage stimulation factor subunit 77 [Panicum miliaceum]|uniref:Cleavage stimulation factor subunit 77 n=1 Tax=Panicum miliaceum TaxID=4540 RepID=A0A3L6R193_PANMI|nr:cleavage stimulation factor subunit 77 [Panicum miliaceum]
MAMAATSTTFRPPRSSPRRPSSLLPINEAAPIYEKLLATFPTAAKYWKQYVEAYMATNNDEATKQIFSRCLLNCLHISLWRCYINFIRRINDKRGSEGLDETKKAFDFMLNYVGNDAASGPVWMEYITFLKSMPAVTPQEESHRMTTVRTVYQKAILVPTNHVEQLWKDYENFENSVSRTLAKGLLSEYQPKFNSAKAVYRERKKYIDDIDWNVLAIPPTGSYKEEQQSMAWKRLLAFEKGNPQRIDVTTANRRVTFTYEQCLMYLYHHPDIWYDYAMWHAKNGSMDSAAKIFQRALKAIPDSEVLKYAFAEMEESRGVIQFIRFLRRTEGIEAARKYFLDARKSPSCTYHVYVAYATMAFCLDKDAKVAQSVFEAGLKRFMQEPGYILEYADFLCRLNDDRNVRALFERALSLLPPEKSIEVWKRFVQFEQTYGDLSSMLKVEQRRKEALSRTSEDVLSASENTLHDVVSRYSFMDLWPCSSKELDYLVRQEWLAKNTVKVYRSATLNTGSMLDKGTVGISASVRSLPRSGKVVRPETSQMVIYDPRQMKDKQDSIPFCVLDVLPVCGWIVHVTLLFRLLQPLGWQEWKVIVEDIIVDLSGPEFSAATSGYTKEVEDMLKMLSPSTTSFIKNLPAIEGPSPDIDVVLSVLLQSTLPVAQNAGKAGGASELSGVGKSGLNQNGSVHRPPRERRKDAGRHGVQEEEDAATVKSQAAVPRDIFRLRQIQRSRGLGVGGAAAASQSGSSAFSFSGGGSAFSGDHSASTD